MPPPRALAFIYWRITRFMEDTLPVDELLNIPGARDERDKRNVAAVSAMGFEVG